MKILFYVLAIAAGAFGFLGLFRAMENALAGNGLEITQLVIGIIGILLATLWVKRARSLGN